LKSVRALGAEPPLTPLRRRLILLTVLGMLPAAVFAALSIYSALSTHKQEIGRSTRDLSRAVASAAVAELDASIGVLHTLAASSELARDDLPGLHRELQAAVGFRGDWNSIVLSDASGAILFRTTAPISGRVGSPVESESLERAIRTRAPQVGPLARGPSGRFAYAVRVPVTRDGELRYVLTATVSPRRMADLLQQQKVPDDWVISIFDSKVQRVARSRDHEKTLGGEPAPLLKTLLGSGSPEGIGVTQSLEGDEIITGFSRVPVHGWTVAVGAPSRILAANIVATLAWYLLGVGASIAVAVVLARRVGGRISAEIDQVMNRASSIGAGDPTTVHAPRTKEIAILLDQVTHADERVRQSEARSMQALGEAREASRAKDEFIAVLSHELRNPLSPIVTVLTLLDMKANEETLKERQILRRQINHMKRLVDDLLDVSRLIHGKITLHRKSLNLHYLLEHVVDAFTHHDSGRICTLSCAPDILIDGDETRLHQVFSNLLNNADRYSAGAPVHIEVKADADVAQIQVIDRGVGIASVDLVRIFEPFYQVDSTRNGVSGNVGLGLSICKKLVELHGGTIGASSLGPQLGTVFVVSLPVGGKSAEAIDIGRTKSGSSEIL